MCFLLYKARFVANGRYGLGVKPTTIRIVLSLVVSQNWHVFQLDVKNTFLHGNLSETVFMHQLLDFRDPNHFCSLHRSLYGLKQTPQTWFHKFSKFVYRFGFTNRGCYI